MKERSSSASPNERTPQTVRFFRLGVVALAATACLALAPAAAIFAPTIDKTVPSDAIFVLGPATAERLSLAESFVERGLSDTIVVSVDSVGVEFSKRSLDLCNEPHDYTVICREPSPLTTQGEARLLQNLSAEFGWQHVTVITRESHVTRSRLYFDRCYSGDTSVIGTTTDVGLTGAAWQYLYQSAGFLKSAILTPGC